MSGPPHPPGSIPSPWHWPPPPSPDHPHDLGMTLGRLLERSEATIGRLDRIDWRLETGDARMDQLAHDIAEMKKAKPEPMPNWERVIKSVLPYLIGGAALLSTGSIDAAIKIFGALGGAK